jgi:hypothetical protein
MSVLSRIWLGISLSLLGACNHHDGASPREVDEVREVRRLLEVTWHPLWEAEGTGTDSMFSGPLRMVADSGHVYILDRGRNAVVALNAADGKLSWRYGGPGSGAQLRAPNAFSLAPSGQVVVFDSEPSRLVILNASGREVRQITVAGVGVSSGLCAMPDGTFVVAPLDPSLGPLVHLSARGSVLKQIDLPWRELNRAPSLGRQLLLAGTEDSCAAALVLGRGFGFLSGGSFREFRDYVEPVEAPRVESVNGGTVQRVRSPVLATSSISFGHDTLAVAFAGRTEHAGRIIDLYDARGGTYLGSYLAPTYVKRFAHAAGRLYVLTESFGATRVAAYVIRPGSSAADADGGRGGNSDPRTARHESATSGTE